MTQDPRLNRRYVDQNIEVLGYGTRFKNAPAFIRALIAALIAPPPPTTWQPARILMVPADIFKGPSSCHMETVSDLILSHQLLGTQWRHAARSMTKGCTMIDHRITGKVI